MDYQKARAAQRRMADVVEDIAKDLYGSKEYAWHRFDYDENLSGVTLPPDYPAIGIRGNNEEGYSLTVKIQTESGWTSMIDSRWLQRVREFGGNTNLFPENMSIEYQEIGRVYAFNRNRPICSGISIGNEALKSSGTLGCFVKRKQIESPIFLLTCNHVIAKRFEGRRGARNQTKIIQPSSRDGGISPHDIVGKLNISMTPVLREFENDIDAAVAEIDPNIQYTPLQNVTGIFDIETGTVINEHVTKVGKTTGRTQGKVTELVTRQAVTYGYFNMFVAEFMDVLEIESTDGGKFSENGDSGSLVVTSEGKALGLLIGGTSNLVDTSYEKTEPFKSYVIPMKKILDELQLELVLSTINQKV